MALSNLQIRIISACILAPLVLSAVWFSGWWGIIVLSVFVVAACWEWARMVRNGKELDIWFREKYYAIGALYISAATASIIILRMQDAQAIKLLFWLFTLNWVMDSCAYFSGRALKGPKICPSISPNKTWSGFFGGLTGVFIYGLILAHFWQLKALQFALFSMILASIGHVGDFFESYIKRKFEVKDSSNLIPGHGGVLDRFDSFIAVVIAVGIFFILMQQDSIFMVFS